MNVLFLYLILSLLCISKEQFVINPHLTEQNSNPIKYMIIYRPKDRSEGVEEYLEKIYQGSYIFSNSFFVCRGQTNATFLLLEDKYYSIKNKDGKIEISYLRSLSGDITYIGYIKEKSLTTATLLRRAVPGPTPVTITDDITFYGINKESKICFYNFELSNSICTNFGITDINISCKPLENRIYICAYSENSKIELKIFKLTDGSTDLQILYPNSGNNQNILTVHDNPVLYDTSRDGFQKILCAYKKSSKEIQCRDIAISVSSGTALIINGIISAGEKDVELSFYSFQDDNCIYINFKSEYLICCGKTNEISCERRNLNLVYINSFNLKLSGAIRNLTIYSNAQEEYAKLIYSNASSSTDKNIYEYYIFPPRCEDRNIELISEKSISLNIDDILFERKTNTNYYILFQNLPTEYGYLYINTIHIEDIGQKILLNNENNILSFISNNDKVINNYEIKYNISIFETYSTECHLSLTIKSCYKSCKTCENIIPDDNNHHCTECKTEENYYPYPQGSSNCFNTTEMNSKNINYYFDNVHLFFRDCHSDCKTCNGPNDNNCLTCVDENLFIYKGKCTDECPESTFISTNEYNYKSCEDCFTNCDTCSGEWDNIYREMKCLTCSEEMITNEYDNSNHLKNCYEIANNILKYFTDPFNDQTISCKTFNKYIIENTFVCIAERPQGYYFSNEETNLLSPCHSDCLTCSRNYTEGNTNCDTCKIGDAINGNCIVSCPQGQYLYQGICQQCHKNCESCSEGASKDGNGKITNMHCTKCKESEGNNNGIGNKRLLLRNLQDANVETDTKPLMIQNEENCFPTIGYTESQITFNITEIDRDKEVGTCYSFNKAIYYNDSKCISKPEHTFYVINNNGNTGVIKNCSIACNVCFGEYTLQNTNCDSCSNGYFKTEDSSTNCLLAIQIGSNYYRNKSDNIYYKCHPNCYSCSTGYNSISGEMNCYICNAGFNKLVGTNNCYNKASLNESFYLQGFIFYPCSQNCLTCS